MIRRKHRVKTHHWEDGILKTVEHLAEALSDALALIEKLQPHHHAKVYNEEGELVHIKPPTNTSPTNTYA
jgi:hypothetical protein